MEKISWTEHSNKLNSAGNDWRRKSPDTDTKKETKDVEPRKGQRKWNGDRLLFLQVFYFRGHPFMTSTKNQVFDPLASVHMRPHGPDPPPCGRPRAVDMKYTPLS